MSMTAYRSHDRFVRWPAVTADACTNYPLTQPNNSAPFCNGMSMNTNRNSDVKCAVVILLNMRGPAAIRRTISRIIVDAIKTFPFWFFSHIVKECLKRFTPARTNGNAPTSVVWVTFIIKVFAALYHVNPRIVDWRARHPVDHIAAKRPTFSVQAATRLRMPARKMPTLDDAKCPTTTQTSPAPLAVVGHVRKRLNNKATKGLIDQVKTWGHGILRRWSEMMVRGRMVGSHLFEPRALSTQRQYITFSIVSEYHGR